MRVAITGGTGFVGRHVAEKLTNDEVVIISRRTGLDLSDVSKLTEAFKNCEVVIHCSGINREIGDQTYEKVHVEGTRNMVAAAKKAGVKKIIMMSFLNARPNSGSPYHETKWLGEEMIRNSGLEYVILKCGMVYGKGDHMIDHISHTLHTLPIFGAVGVTGSIPRKTIRPIPVEELVTIIVAAAENKLAQGTYEVVGDEELTLTEAVKRIAEANKVKVKVIPLPIIAHKILSQITEWTMKVPLVAKAQLRMLTEGISQAYNADSLPENLKPKLPFNQEQIKKSLPEAGRFTFNDLLISKRFKNK